MAVSEIPLAPTPQTFSIQLGAITYRLRTYLANVDLGGWCLDIADALGNPLICGMPLVTGTDLLGQYRYLGFGGSLWVVSDGGDIGAVPTPTNLGITSHLYWQPDA